MRRAKPLKTIYTLRSKTVDEKTVSASNAEALAENLPSRDEIRMFIDINTQQVKVSRNLVNEIVASMDIDDSDPAKRLDAMHARLALRLDQYPSSPIRDRILTVAQDKDNFRCLTLTSLADGAHENQLLGSLYKPRKSSPATLLPGPLADVTGDPHLTLERAVVALSRYLALFSNRLEEHWRLGDAKGGYLCTNNGLRSLFALLKRLISHLESKFDVKALLLGPEDLIDRVSPLVTPLVDYFLTASATDVGAFRGRGSSLLSVSENTKQMAAIIHEAIPSFAPPDVLAYMASRARKAPKKPRR